MPATTITAIPIDPNNMKGSLEVILDFIKFQNSNGVNIISYEINMDNAEVLITL